MDDQLQAKMDKAIQDYRQQIGLSHAILDIMFLRVVRCRERLLRLIELQAPDTIIDGEIDLLNMQIAQMEIAHDQTGNMH